MENLFNFIQYKISDSHIHLTDLFNLQVELINDKNYFCSASVHSQNDFSIIEKIKTGNISNIFISYGVHPQKPEVSEIYFLEKLLNENKISSIGEFGFDLFNKEFKETIDDQIKVFETQLELALRFNKTIVLHGRKSTELFFRYKKELKKLPHVVFHSFCGGINEALSFLNNGINAKFSFSKQILNGNKKAIECTQKLPVQNLLFETDAPYQTLKGETKTFPDEILSVYQKAYEIRKEKNSIDFSEKIVSNFLDCFL